MTDHQFVAVCVIVAAFVGSAIVAAWQTQANATRRALDEHGPPPGRLADRLVGHLTETRRRAGIQSYETRELS